MTDIESNILYRRILQDFREQFDVACRRSYVIALPSNETLQNVVIDQILVNSHILMPSKLLKMHYTPLQVGHAADDIEIDGNRLIIYPEKQQQQEDDPNQQQTVVKILAEEIGYNTENRPYRLLLIDRPLTSNQQQYPSKQRSALFLMKSLSLFGGMRRGRIASPLEPPEPLADHNDCSRYLEGISQELTVELERQVQQVQSRYIILSHYLQDAAERISQLTETFIPRYMDLIGAQRQADMSDNVFESIRISVENYAIHLLHGKLIASIYHRYELQDARFERKLALLRLSQLSVCKLGAQKPFNELEIDDEVKQNLQAVASLQSPLAMVNTIVKIVDGISANLDNCVRSRQLQMDQEASQVTICSDDLIASLIFALVQARPSRIYSMSKYLELFNWNARDKAAYYTATFHLVVQYIYNYQTESSSNIIQDSDHQ